MTTSLAVSDLTTPAPLRRVDAYGRGTLTMSDKVIQKIAAQAATEIGAARGKSGGLLGIGSHVDVDARPKVEVELSVASADITIEVGIAYPGSIRRVSEQMRSHVTQRVQELTGVEVHRVDIDVSFLSVGDANHTNTGELR